MSFASPFGGSLDDCTDSRDSTTKAPGVECVSPEYSSLSDVSVGVTHGPRTRPIPTGVHVSHEHLCHANAHTFRLVCTHVRTSHGHTLRVVHVHPSYQYTRSDLYTNFTPLHVTRTHTRSELYVSHEHTHSDLCVHKHTHRTGTRRTQMNESFTTDPWVAPGQDSYLLCTPGTGHVHVYTYTHTGHDEVLRRSCRTMFTFVRQT